MRGSEMNAGRSLGLGVAFLIAAILAFGAPGAVAAEKRKLSEHHALGILPHMKKEVGEKVMKGVIKFFEEAEYAIETENLEGLMELYSANYRNGPHARDDARRIWKRIFDEFDGLATIHNMRIENYSAKTGVMIIRCTGILMGNPKDDPALDLISIDTWTSADHVIVNEGGVWRLLGTSGKPRKRFWFDKPMHPLF